MVIQPGSISGPALGALLVLFGLVGVGHTTWALSNGASPDDPGILSYSTDTRSNRTHRPGTAFTLSTQRQVGGIAMILGGVFTGIALVLPGMLKGEDD